MLENLKIRKSIEVKKIVLFLGNYVLMKFNMDWIKIIGYVGILWYEKREGEWVDEIVIVFGIVLNFDYIWD